ncbi:MAG: hypothetical protein GY749_19630 [Desulfobacteraceae bacterium]|nr:hypothetical protein [Desulfobacteraceae bacterium]
MTIQQDEKFTELKRVLQIFQSNRINSTYADLKEDPEYTKIGTFFFEKLYAPEDFSFRDASIKKLHRILNGAVYKGMVSAVTLVIELHELSDELDNIVVEKMIKSGVGADMNMEQYQDVYRQLDNYDQRIYQIKLSTRVNEAFHRLSKMWIVGLSLKTVRTAARLIGMGKIMDFIHEGYVGFRTIDDIRFFVETIEGREIAWHNEIWFGKNNERKIPAKQEEA